MARATSRRRARTKSPSPAARRPKYVYSFANGKADGSSALRHLLGGKGCELAEMTNMGVSVPPGFTITTEAWAAYSKGGRKQPAGLWGQVEAGLARLEAAVELKLGDTAKPLLVSVRSGARASMPGMMDTVLNLGLNDRHGDRPRALDQERALRVGLLPAVHHDLRRRRPRHRAPRIRRAAGPREGRRARQDRRGSPARAPERPSWPSSSSSSRRERASPFPRIRPSSSRSPSTRSSTRGSRRRRWTTGASTGCPTTGARRSPSWPWSSATSASPPARASASRATRRAGSAASSASSSSTRRERTSSRASARRSPSPPSRRACRRSTTSS